MPRWINNPGKVTLVVALIGGFLVLLGQLSATLIPIMYGPADISDFEIGTNPIGLGIGLRSDNNETLNPQPYCITNISANDFHHYLRPYRYNIFLRAESPAGIITTFDPFQIKAGESSTMEIVFTKNMPAGQYHILIQGIGGNGKIRNTTFYINVIGIAMRDGKTIIGDEKPKMRLNC
jgi:hypothetical protein